MVDKRKKYKVYRESSWSWFYKNFIKNTVTDNFYTPTEIIDRQKEIIERVKKHFPIKK